MRQENLERLSYPVAGINHPYYIEYKFLFKDLKDAAQQYAKGDLLDIGCGNKPYRPFFDGKLTSYIGCDIIQSDKNLVDIICPATDIPLADNCKDTVFSTQVIEHVADHRKLLSEAFRILKPGGHLIVSGPMAWEHHEEPYDFFRFTRYGFEYILTETGFTDIIIVPNGGKWAMVGQLLHNSLRSSCYGKKSIKARLLKGVYFLFRLKWIINLFFVWLDNFDKDYSSTLNFVVIARKP
ncbi:MAG TPA: methyltransferase domain-containing protein [Flavipsychrobacter sp.]|nr:methyltransferase domain-containing protein [Flavipsychrobacter sp.]